MNAQQGFALLPQEKRIRGKGQGQGGTLRICRALLASVGPVEHACMETKVEGHLLSTLVGEYKDKLGPALDSALAELKLGRFPVSCLPHPPSKQHFGEMSANPLPFWDRCGSCHSQHQVAGGPPSFCSSVCGGGKSLI